jgi:hypothetical protein
MHVVRNIFIPLETGTHMEDYTEIFYITDEGDIRPLSAR